MIKDEWQTPKWLLDDIEKRYGRIKFDPCTTPDNPTGASKFYTKEDNGLIQSWERGPADLAFINPPYGSRNLVEWTNRILQDPGPWVALVPARTCTKWWHQMHQHSDSVRFLQGLVSFIDPFTKTTGIRDTIGSCLFYLDREIFCFHSYYDFSLEEIKILKQYTNTRRLSDALYVIRHGVETWDAITRVCPELLPRLCKEFQYSNDWPDEERFDRIPTTPEDIRSWLDQLKDKIEIMEYSH